MRTRRHALPILGAALAGGLLALLPSQAVRAQDRTFVMKLSTATLNDTQHEYLKRLAANVEKDSGGRIKGEVYPASQLGPIPRQIEGVQFGSIQGWMGPPEFLVGVDVRYETLAAPGLFSSQSQAEKVMADPAVQKLLFGLGDAKGLEGIGLLPIGPSSIAMRKEAKTLADLKGQKIRVLASPFQHQDAAKFVMNNDQPYISSIFVLSKRWMATLPPDLQKIVRDNCTKLNTELVTFVREFFANQTNVWKSRGGQIIEPPAAEKAAVTAKISTIANDLSKDKPDLAAAVKVVFDAAARHK